ncbi:LptF/LptG family permease [bacterium]|nr:LptF/LptG family permease [bacterium]
MTLARYVARLFVGAWVGITALLALLFTLIEFFEKLARVKHASLEHILYFLKLNFVPSAFDVLPAAAWLATLFVLRELSLHQSWDFLRLVGFVPLRLAGVLTLVACVALCVILPLREWAVLPLAQRAEQFKYTHFKNMANQHILHAWFELEADRFCYVESLDSAAGVGNGLLLLKLGPTRQVVQVTHAPNFSLDEKAYRLWLDEAVSVQLAEQQVERFARLEIPSVYFFRLVALRQEVYTLAHVARQLAFRAYLPKTTVRLLLTHLFESSLYYLSLLLYPALTVGAFCIRQTNIQRWLLALLPYPALIALSLLARHAGWALWMLGAGCLFFLLVIFVRKNIA